MLEVAAYRSMRSYIKSNFQASHFGSIDEKVPPWIPIVEADITTSPMLGWSTKIPIEQTLSDILDYWRLSVSNSQT